jgi:K+-dependent Na+/Ca+ exchanger-like protein
MVSFSILEQIFGTCDCQGTFDCQSAVDASGGGIIIWALITLYMFKALGTVCDEYFVPSLEMISEKLGLSNDVAGATFMAAGSSAPELFTSLVATFLIVNEGGVGAIIGSAIFNILVIVGATCVFAGQVLDIWWYPLARDCSFYVLSILLLALFIMDETVEWWEGLIMFLTYCVYCIYMKYNERIARCMMSSPKVSVAGDIEQNPYIVKEDLGKNEELKFGAIESDVSTSVPSVASAPSEFAVKETMAIAGVKDTEGNKEPHDMPSLPPHPQPSAHSSESVDDKCKDESQVENDKEEEAPVSRTNCIDPINLLWEKIMPSPEKYWSLFFMSILNIAFCTYFMVDAVNRSGCNLNISPLVMGLVFLAAGTSIPDALGSIAVAKQGEGDMAVANALGSNVFDILLGLGVPWFISGALGQNVVFQGVSADLLYWICVLLGVLVLFIATLIFSKWKLNKTVGVILMTLYVIHVSLALIRAFVSL